MSIMSRLVGGNLAILGRTEFQTLLFINFILTLGIVPLTPILSELTVPFGVSEASIGLVVTAFIIPSIVISPLIGVLVDRVGRRPIFIACLAVFGASGVAIAFVDRFAFVIALRLVQGVGFAGASPLVITCIGDLYSPPTETTAQGLSFTTVGIGEVIFPAVVGVIVTIAWQIPFLLYALALFAAVVVYWWFPEPTPSEDDQHQDGAVTDSTVTQLLFVVRQRRAIAFILALSASSFVYTGFITYVSFLIAGKGGDATVTGIVVALTSVVLAVTATQAGRVTTVFGNRTYPLITAGIVQALGIVAVVFSPLQYVYPLTVLLGIGNGLIFPLSRSIITDIAPAEIRGSFVSFAESIGRLGIALGPALMGGFISMTRSRIGTDGAVRWAVALVAVVFTVLMTAFLLLALFSEPIDLKYGDERRTVT